MIYFSSPLTATGLCNIAMHLSQGDPSQLKEATRILGLLPLEDLLAEATRDNVETLLDQGDEKSDLTITDTPDTAVGPQPFLPQLLRVLALLNRTEEVSRLLKAIPAHRHSTPEITNGIIKVANDLLMQGKKEDARSLIGKLEWHGLNSPEQLSDLGMTHNRLGIFGVAAQIFAFAEDKGLRCPNFYTHKAITHIGLLQLTQAENCITQEIDCYGPSILSLYWETRLLNIGRRHADALSLAEKLICDYATSPTHLCFSYIEQGIALRASGSPLDALSSFENAIARRDISPLWLWIAYFEYAITLAISGRIEEAVNIATEGQAIESAKSLLPYNPCNVLSEFLRHRYGLQPALPSLEVWMNYAKRWPWPFLPYQLWIGVFTAMILTDQSPPLREGQYKESAKAVAEALSGIPEKGRTAGNNTNESIYDRSLDELALSAFAHLYGGVPKVEMLLPRNRPEILQSTKIGLTDATR